MRSAKKQQQHRGQLQGIVAFQDNRHASTRGYCPSMVQPSNSFPPGQRPKYFLSRSASPPAFPSLPFHSLPFPSLPFLSQASIPIPYSALPPPPPSPLPAPKPWPQRLLLHAHVIALRYGHVHQVIASTHTLMALKWALRRVQAPCPPVDPVDSGRAHTRPADPLR